MDATPLTGGRQTPGVVRVGSTVRRPLHRRSAYVHALLRHLEAVGFEGAPRVLGIDEQGREILSYVEGDVPDGSPTEYSAAALRSSAALIRGFHDATAGTALAGGGEVVCHGDLGPHNTVFRGERAVALIDWDESVGAGSRLVDLAHAVSCFADVGEPALALDHQAFAIRVMCDEYGWLDRGAIVDEIGARLRRARDQHARHGRARSVSVFEGMIARFDAVAPALKRQL